MLVLRGGGVKEICCILSVNSKVISSGLNLAINDISEVPSIQKEENLYLLNV